MQDPVCCCVHLTYVVPSITLFPWFHPAVACCKATMVLLVFCVGKCLASTVGYHSTPQIQPTPRYSILSCKYNPYSLICYAILWILSCGDFPQSKTLISWLYFERLLVSTDGHLSETPPFSTGMVLFEPECNVYGFNSGDCSYLVG